MDSQGNYQPSNTSSTPNDFPLSTPLKPGEITAPPIEKYINNKENDPKEIENSNEAYIISKGLYRAELASINPSYERRIYLKCQVPNYNRISTVKAKRFQASNAIQHYQSKHYYVAISKARKAIKAIDKLIYLYDFNIIIIYILIYIYTYTNILYLFIIEPRTQALLVNLLISQGTSIKDLNKILLLILTI